MSIKDNFPAVRPTLLVDFRNSETVDPRIVSARASTATYTDQFGVIQTALSNVPRITFDAVTGECLGLMREEQRTNLVLNSAVLVTQNVTVTAVAHTLSFYGAGTVTLSGTATATVVGLGAYSSRKTLTFTPTAGTLTFPDTSVQSTAWNPNKPVPLTNKGSIGDLAGHVAIDSTYIYYCTTAYTDGVADIWKRVALGNDTW
jgi:hypothetical protein